jgi:hypothetical protein
MFASNALVGVTFRPYLESTNSGVPVAGSPQVQLGSGLTHFSSPPPPCIPGCTPCFCCPPDCPPPCNPPTISGIQDTPSSKGAVAKISWADDLGTSESFVYGLTGGYGSSATPSNHAVTLSGLQVPAVYYFKITASYICSANGAKYSSSASGSFWTSSSLGGNGGLCPYGNLGISAISEALSGSTVTVAWTVSPGTNAILGGLISQTFQWGTSNPPNNTAPVTSNAQGASSASFSSVPATFYYVSISASSACYSTAVSNPSFGVASVLVQVFTNYGNNPPIRFVQVEIGSTTYNDGQSALLIEPATYTATAVNQQSYIFQQWVTSGGTSVNQATANPAQLTVSSLTGSLGVVSQLLSGYIWGGYVQSGTSVSSVSADMVVPSVGLDYFQGTQTSTEIVNFWVGIGGNVGTAGLWQAGIAISISPTIHGPQTEDCAFYEWDPPDNSGHENFDCASGLITPGSTVAMSVTYSPSSGTCAFQVTDGGSDSASGISCAPDTHTADVVGEAPQQCGTGGCYYDALPAFGSPSFTAITIQDGITTYTSLDGPLVNVTAPDVFSAGTQTLMPSGLLAVGVDQYTIIKSGA